MIIPDSKQDFYQTAPTGATMSRESLRWLAHHSAETEEGRRAAALLEQWDKNGAQLPDDIGVSKRQGEMLGVTVPRNFGGG